MTPNRSIGSTGFVGYHLDLEFEEGETFLGISAGDPEALNYSAHDSILTLRPRAEMAQMNLTVSTSKRRYYFEYSVSARRPNAAVDEVMYAVRFSYPAGKSGGEMTTEQRVALELARAAVSRPRNCRLLVLRWRRRPARGGLGRWRADPPDVRTEPRAAGALRAQ